VYYYTWAVLITTQASERFEMKMSQAIDELDVIRTQAERARRSGVVDGDFSDYRYLIKREACLLARIRKVYPGFSPDPMDE
jgi:RIO-like serine/threonine protein kinase